MRAEKAVERLCEVHPEFGALEHLPIHILPRGFGGLLHPTALHNALHERHCSCTHISASRLSSHSCISEEQPSRLSVGKEK